MAHIDSLAEQAALAAYERAAERAEHARDWVAEQARERFADHARERAALRRADHVTRWLPVAA